MISAMTLAYPEEAMGISRAAKKAGLPCVISFSLDTDGKLHNKSPLGQAIERVDASCRPEYYTINCAHPDHFVPTLRQVIS